MLLQNLLNISGNSLDRKFFPVCKNCIMFEREEYASEIYLDEVSRRRVSLFVQDPSKILQRPSRTTRTLPIPEFSLIDRRLKIPFETREAIRNIRMILINWHISVNKLFQD